MLAKVGGNRVTQSSVADEYGADVATGEFGGNAPSGGFNFGQFRHGGRGLWACLLGLGKPPNIRRTPNPIVTARSNPVSGG